jgi:hypothetical protein
MQRYTPEQREEAKEQFKARRRLRYQIAGGERAYFALPKEERKDICEKAVVLAELGADFATAQRAQEVDLRGFVYVITNPAWDDYCKIGRAFDPESRLKGYQTSSPFRDYELYGARYFDNAAQAEMEMHMRLAKYREEGEWFYIDPATALVEIDKLQEQLF